MTATELKEFLTDHLVPAKLYEIGKAIDGKVCMTKNKDFWEVYFLDHAEKIGLMCFKDENSACQSMKNELRKLMESIYELTWKPIMPNPQG